MGHKLGGRLKGRLAMLREQALQREAALQRKCDVAVETVKKEKQTLIAEVRDEKRKRFRMEAETKDLECFRTVLNGCPSFRGGRDTLAVTVHIDPYSLEYAMIRSAPEDRVYAWGQRIESICTQLSRSVQRVVMDHLMKLQKEHRGW